MVRLLTAVLGVVLIACAACDTAGVKIDKSPEAQKKREAFIQTLRQEHILDKIDFSTLAPRVWVAPGFESLQFEHKQNISAMIFAYHFPDGTSSGNFLRLIDGRTGKEVGQYRPARGLMMD